MAAMAMWRMDFMPFVSRNVVRQVYSVRAAAALPVRSMNSAGPNAFGGMGAVVWFFRPSLSDCSCFRFASTWLGRYDLAAARALVLELDEQTGSVLGSWLGPHVFQDRLERNSRDASSRNRCSVRLAADREPGMD